MTVDKHQAQMLATIAVACRPHGAPHWDEAGVMAAIVKIKHLSLADVTLAVIRAADDRSVRTPGVIGNVSSPCWKERGTDRPQRIEEPENHERCSTCSLHRDRCRSLHADDHDFRPWTERPQIDTKATVAALKGFIEPTAVPPEPKPPLPEETL